MHGSASIHQSVKFRNALKSLVALWTRDKFDCGQNNLDSFRCEAGFALCRFM